MKQVLIDILDYLRWQVANDRCTAAQIASIYESVVRNTDVEGTVDDMSAFFGKSRGNVKNVIYRNVMPKPKRRVYYSFRSFVECLPKTWRRTENAESER